MGSIAVGKVGERLSFVQGRVHVGEQRVTPVLQALRRHLAPEGIRILDAPRAPPARCRRRLPTRLLPAGDGADALWTQVTWGRRWRRAAPWTFRVVSS